MQQSAFYLHISISSGLKCFSYVYVDSVIRYLVSEILVHYTGFRDLWQPYLSFSPFTVALVACNGQLENTYSLRSSARTVTKNSAIAAWHCLLKSRLVKLESNTLHDKNLRKISLVVSLPARSFRSQLNRVYAVRPTWSSQNHDKDTSLKFAAFPKQFHSTNFGLSSSHYCIFDFSDENEKNMMCRILGMSKKWLHWKQPRSHVVSYISKNQENSQQKKLLWTNIYNVSKNIWWVI